jgi:hypothetical protein
MASLFHAIFGICRNKGGTKKACYKKAIGVVATPSRRKRSKKGGRRKRSSWCLKWGYSKKHGVPVCRKRRTRKAR